MEPVERGSRFVLLGRRVGMPIPMRQVRGCHVGSLVMEGAPPCPCSSTQIEWHPGDEHGREKAVQNWFFRDSARAGSCAVRRPRCCSRVEIVKIEFSLAL